MPDLRALEFGLPRLPFTERSLRTRCRILQGATGGVACPLSFPEPLKLKPEEEMADTPTGMPKSAATCDPGSPPRWGKMRTWLREG